jgi:hypothetical protein
VYFGVCLRRPFSFYLVLLECCHVGDKSKLASLMLRYQKATEIQGKGSSIPAIIATPPEVPDLLVRTSCPCPDILWWTANVWMSPADTLWSRRAVHMSSAQIANPNCEQTWLWSEVLGNVFTFWDSYFTRKKYNLVYRNII